MCSTPSTASLAPGRDHCQGLRPHLPPATYISLKLRRSFQYQTFSSRVLLPPHLNVLRNSPLPRSPCRVNRSRNHPSLLRAPLDPTRRPHLLRWLPKHRRDRPLVPPAIRTSTSQHPRGRADRLPFHPRQPALCRPATRQQNLMSARIESSVYPSISFVEPSSAPTAASAARCQASFQLHHHQMLADDPSEHADPARKPKHAPSRGSVDRRPDDPRARVPTAIPSLTAPLEGASSPGTAAPLPPIPPVFPQEEPLPPTQTCPRSRPSRPADRRCPDPFPEFFRKCTVLFLGHSEEFHVRPARAASLPPAFSIASSLSFPTAHLAFSGSRT